MVISSLREVNGKTLTKYLEKIFASHHNEAFAGEARDNEIRHGDNFLTELASPPLELDGDGGGGGDVEYTSDYTMKTIP